MSDQQSERPQRPVVNGLIALVAVALTVGLILGGAVLIGTKMLGFGGDGGGAAGATEQESMSIPPLEKTTGSGGPEITLNTATPTATAEESSESAEESDSSEATESESARKGEISLSAGATEVENFGKIPLTGTYPGGEGAVLQVQRYQGGEWVDFAATVAVSGQTFSTYVQTGVSGVNTFRMIHKQSGVTSNQVKVTVNS